MNKSILILEENSVIHGLVASALEVDGLTLHHEFNPEKYVETARSLMPDLILISNVDQQTDYAVCRELRQGESLAGVPVILMANSRETLDPEKIQELHLEGVIRKPFEAGDLQQQVSKHLDVVDLVGGAVEFRRSQSMEEAPNPLSELDVLEPEVLALLQQAGESPLPLADLAGLEMDEELAGEASEIMVDEEVLETTLRPEAAFEEVGAAEMESLAGASEEGLDSFDLKDLAVEDLDSPANIPPAPDGPFEGATFAGEGGSTFDTAPEPMELDFGEDGAEAGNDFLAAPAEGLPLDPLETELDADVVLEGEPAEAEDILEDFSLETSEEGWDELGAGDLLEAETPEEEALQPSAMEQPLEAELQSGEADGLPLEEIEVEFSDGGVDLTAEEAEPPLDFSATGPAAEDAAIPPFAGAGEPDAPDGEETILTLEGAEVALSEEDVDYAALNHELAEGEVALETGLQTAGEEDADIPPAVRRMMEMKPVFTLSQESRQAPELEENQGGFSFVSGDDELDKVIDDLETVDEISLLEESIFEDSETPAPAKEEPATESAPAAGPAAEEEEPFDETLLGDEELDEDKILAALEADAGLGQEDEEPDDLTDLDFGDPDAEKLAQLADLEDSAPLEGLNAEEELILDQDEEAIMLAALEEDQSFEKSFAAGPAELEPEVLSPEPGLAAPPEQEAEFTALDGEGDLPPLEEEAEFKALDGEGDLPPLEEEAEFTALDGEGDLPPLEEEAEFTALDGEGDLPPLEGDAEFLALDAEGGLPPLEPEGELPPLDAEAEQELSQLESEMAGPGAPLGTENDFSALAGDAPAMDSEMATAALAALGAEETAVAGEDDLLLEEELGGAGAGASFPDGEEEPLPDALLGEFEPNLVDAIAAEGDTGFLDEEEEDGGVLPLATLPAEALDQEPSHRAEAALEEDDSLELTLGDPGDFPPLDEGQELDLNEADAELVEEDYPAEGALELEEEAPPDGPATDGPELATADFGGTDDEERDFLAELGDLKEEIAKNPVGETLSEVLAQEGIEDPVDDLELSVPEEDGNMGRAMGVFELLDGEESDAPGAGQAAEAGLAAEVEAMIPGTRATDASGGLQDRVIDEGVKARLGEVLDQIITISVRKAMQEEMPKLMEKFTKHD